MSISYEKTEKEDKKLKILLNSINNINFKRTTQAIVYGKGVPNLSLPGTLLIIIRYIF